jgi:hypothetical protein
MPCYSPVEESYFAQYQTFQIETFSSLVNIFNYSACFLAGPQSGDTFTTFFSSSFSWDFG